MIHYRWSGLYDDGRSKPKSKPKVKPQTAAEPELDDEGYWSSEPFDVSDELSEAEEKGKEELAEDDEDINITPLHWPTPIHDVLFGYSWICQNLQPKYPQRKDVYICGSYLGASLAAGLALSESYPHARMAVRGLLAYNGIYDWTTFLPDHPIHRPKGDDRILIEEQLDKLNRDLDEDGGPAATSPIIAHYQRRLEDLFGSPSGLFDSFASACLFFHTAGLFIPPTFDEKYVPEWLLPPPPGPLITGANGVSGVNEAEGQHIDDPHDPFTPPATPHQPESPSQNLIEDDDFDPDYFEHYDTDYEQHHDIDVDELSSVNDLDLDIDPNTFEPCPQQYGLEEISMLGDLDLDHFVPNNNSAHHSKSFDYSDEQGSEQSEPDSPPTADDYQYPVQPVPGEPAQTLHEVTKSMINDASGEPDSVAAADLIQEATRTHSLQEIQGDSHSSLKVQIYHAKFPRKSYVHFPPRHSMLRLPDTLLLYETPSSAAAAGGELPAFRCDALAQEGVEGSGAMSLSARYLRNQIKKEKREQKEEEEEEDQLEEDDHEVENREQGAKTEKRGRGRPRLKTRRHRRPPVAITAGENSFRTQAYELALLMQRSIETLELKDRRKWDEDYLVDLHYWEMEAARRVKVADVGVVDDQDMEIGDLEGVGDLDERGREIVLEWLEEKMDKAR